MTNAVEIFSYLETPNKLFSSGKQTILNELMYYFFFFKTTMHSTCSYICAACLK